MDKKIALLIDVDNVKMNSEAFNELFEKMNSMGELVYCKFYGYNDRKHIQFSDIITKYGYETAPFMRFKKRFSQLDNRMFVDAVKLNYTKPEINSYCIVAGEGDLIPLLVELKSSGRNLIDINTEYQELNYHMFDTHIKLFHMDDDDDNYQPKTKKKAKEEKVVEKAVKKEKHKKPSIIVDEVDDDEEDEVEQIKQVAEQPVVEQPKVEQKPAKNDEEYDTDELSGIIQDITERYSELDFSNNSDMDKKLELINDIETLIQEETDNGQGLKSKHEDVRQIFNELQSIVNDMKSAL